MPTRSWRKRAPISTIVSERPGPSSRPSPATFRSTSPASFSRRTSRRTTKKDCSKRASRTSQARRRAEAERNERPGRTPLRRRVLRRGEGPGRRARGARGVPTCLRPGSRARKGPLKSRAPAREARGAAFRGRRAHRCSRDRGPPPEDPPSQRSASCSQRSSRRPSRAARPGHPGGRSADRHGPACRRGRSRSPPRARRRPDEAEGPPRVRGRPLSSRRFRHLGGQRAARRFAREAPRKSPRGPARTRPGLTHGERSTHMAEISAQEITQLIKAQLAGITQGVDIDEVGTVVSVGDGIALAYGLEKVMAGELLEFPNGVYGLALNLEEGHVGCVLMGETSLVKEGDTVKRTKRIISVPVGEALVGRVVNPLGQPIDGKGPVASKEFYPVERLAPGVVDRMPVKEPMQTGLKAIDSMIPIGRGQRELIIGDRQTGKTAIALDTIINQKGTGVICVYVAIGQKNSTIAQVVQTLEQHGAMEHTIVVAAAAADPAPLQYISAYAGCAMGEYFMYTGKHALVVYDDLSKQAASYREISLLLRRPPGREAYPGDVFYLHSRLLERASKLNKEKGGGSLTALPIIETQAGDVSAYIPTNVISITDGQIFLATNLFYQGVRPAVSVGISVSRVGSAAQVKAMKQVAGRLKGDLAQFRELAAFAQFGSDLDAKTQSQIERGKRIMEVFKQPPYNPIPIEVQVAVLWVAQNGFIDDVPVDKVKDFQNKLTEFLTTRKPELLAKIQKEKALSDPLTAELKAAATEFKQTYK